MHYIHCSHLAIWRKTNKLALTKQMHVCSTTNQGSSISFVTTGQHTADNEYTSFTLSDLARDLKTDSSNLVPCYWRHFLLPSQQFLTTKSTKRMRLSGYNCQATSNSECVRFNVPSDTYEVILNKLIGFHNICYWVFTGYMELRMNSISVLKGWRQVGTWWYFQHKEAISFPPGRKKNQYYS